MTKLDDDGFVDGDDGYYDPGGVPQQCVDSDELRQWSKLARSILWLAATTGSTVAINLTLASSPSPDDAARAVIPTVIGFATGFVASTGGGLKGILGSMFGAKK